MITPPERFRKPLERPIPTPIPTPPHPVTPLATDEVQRLLREVLSRLDSIEKRLESIEHILLTKPR